jgi:hypothetical protein
MDSAFPLPFYDDTRDLIVWAKYDRDLEHYLVVHEGDTLPEKFGKIPWAVSLDPRVITNPEGLNTPAGETKPDAPAPKTTETLASDPEGKDRLPWGEAVRGVQIRLRDAKPARGDGVTSPVLLLLKTDATNTGNLLLHLAENGNNCQVEVDGQWYMWFPDSALERIGEVKRDGDGAGKGSALLDFGGGKRYTDLSVTIGSHHWRALPAGRAEEIAALQWGNTFLAYRSEDIGAAMRLSPGKHRVRVAYNCGSARAGQDIGSVRAVSNPLEVEIP